MQQHKSCLDCNTVLVGRKDKKFCSDHCRSNFNNKKNRADSTLFRRTNSILKKNRTILSHLYQKGIRTISKDDLVEYGFRFGFFTQFKRSPEGIKLYFCYDQAIHKLDNNLFGLHRKTKAEALI